MNKEPIQSLYNELKKIGCWNKEDRLEVFRSMYNDILITQQDLPTLLKYFDNQNRMLVFRIITLDSIDSLYAVECLKLFPTIEDKFGALNHMIGKIRFTSLSHKRKIIQMFTGNKRLQQRASEIISIYQIIKENGLLSSNQEEPPPPYDYDENKKLKTRCTCVIL